MHVLVAGVPAGVVNMVFGIGPRAGEALVKHPNIPLISFTGSTVVGRKIQALSAPFVKRLSLEVCEPIEAGSGCPKLLNKHS